MLDHVVISKRAGGATSTDSSGGGAGAGSSSRHRKKGAPASAVDESSMSANELWDVLKHGTICGVVAKSLHLMFVCSFLMNHLLLPLTVICRCTTDIPPRFWIRHRQPHPRRARLLPPDLHHRRHRHRIVLLVIVIVLSRRCCAAASGCAQSERRTRSNPDAAAAAAAANVFSR